MITIRLCGGLGNQLFQWALGRSLENCEHEVQFDMHDLDHEQGRRYMLGDLGLRMKTGSAPLVVSRNRWTQLINEVSLRFNPEIIQSQDDTYLSGYWQSEKYFSEIAERLRAEVFPNVEKVGQQSYAMGFTILEKQSCFIHVRRSDNLRPTSTLYHGLTDAKQAPYYQRAIKIMRERFPGVTFFVFSDDPDWIRANMTDSDMVCVTHNAPSFTVDETHNLHKASNGREVEDLYLMSLCRHAIIANSTFSWWGAWLNQDEGKEPRERLVIAPDPWFSGETELDSTDIIPERWMKVGT